MHTDPWWPADLKLCRVCGWSLGEPGWAGFDDSPQHIICDCCGAETGVDDITETSALRYRATWLARGAPWWQGTAPPGWSATRQLDRAGIQVRRKDLRG